MVAARIPVGWSSCINGVRSSSWRTALRLVCRCNANRFVPRHAHRVLRLAFASFRRSPRGHHAVLVDSCWSTAYRCCATCRPAVHHHGAIHYRYWFADSPICHWVHARRPEVLEVLFVPQPVRVLHAYVGAWREPACYLPWLGRRGRLLLLPHFVLAHTQ